MTYEDVQALDAEFVRQHFGNSSQGGMASAQPNAGPNSPKTGFVDASPDQGSRTWPVSAGDIGVDDVSTGEPPGTAPDAVATENTTDTLSTTDTGKNHSTTSSFASEPTLNLPLANHTPSLQIPASIVPTAPGGLSYPTAASQTTSSPSTVSQHLAAIPVVTVQQPISVFATALMADAMRVSPQWSRVLANLTPTQAFEMVEVFLSGGKASSRALKGSGLTHVW